MNTPPTTWTPHRLVKSVAVSLPHTQTHPIMILGRGEEEAG
jgi:hypothetical protein